MDTLESSAGVSKTAEPDLDLTAAALQGCDTAGSFQEDLHDVQAQDFQAGALQEGLQDVQGVDQAQSVLPEELLVTAPYAAKLELNIAVKEDEEEKFFEEGVVIKVVNEMEVVVQFLDWGNLATYTKTLPINGGPSGLS